MTHNGVVRTGAGSTNDNEGGEGDGEPTPHPEPPTSTSNELAEYLVSAKRRFRTLSSSSSSTTTTTTPVPFHFVLGNEAGDADSIVSAIAHAYWLETRAMRWVHPAESSNVVVLPVASISTQDLQTQRPETLYMLRTLAGLDEPIDAYLCDVHDLAAFLSSSLGDGMRDDSETTQESRPESVRTFQAPRHKITLVDHNELSSALRTLAASDDETGLEVVGIVDHHLDMKCHTDTCPPENTTTTTTTTTTKPSTTVSCAARNVAYDEATGQALVASTCTLVVEEMLHTVDDDKANHPFVLPPQASVLLLGTILLDSINLDRNAGKVTDRDVAAVHDLLNRTDWSQLGAEAKHVLGMSNSETISRPDTTVLFNLLQSAKFDPAFWSALSVRDALRLDYKQFEVKAQEDGPASCVWGMSTVLLDWDAFANKVEWKTAIQEYVAENELDMLVIMLASSSIGSKDGTTERDDQPAPLQRQLVLCDVRSGSIVNDLVDHLLRPHSADVDLRLVEMTGRSATQQISQGPSDTLCVRSFHQGNAKASRKQVAPLLFDYFKTRSAQTTNDG